MSFLISISIYPQPINSIKIYFTTQIHHDQPKSCEKQPKFTKNHKILQKKNLFKKPKILK